MGAFVLLGFAQRCQEDEKKRPIHARASVFERLAVRDAFIKASKEHAENLFHELEYLRPFLDAFKTDSVSHRVRCTEEQLIELFGNTVEDGSDRITPEVSLKILTSLGILRHRPGAYWNRDRYDYEIPPIYKFALKLRPKGRV
jgi:hypothetical protein